MHLRFRRRQIPFRILVLATIAILVAGGLGVALLLLSSGQRPKTEPASRVAQSGRPAADGAYENWRSAPPSLTQAPSAERVRPRVHSSAKPSADRIELAAFEGLAAGPAAEPESNRDLTLPSPAGLSDAALAQGRSSSGDDPCRRVSRQRCGGSGTGVSMPGGCSPPVTIAVPKSRPYVVQPRCGR